MLRHAQVDGNSTARVFALTARATPPNLSFMGEKTLSALFRFRTNLRKARAVPRETSTSPPRRPPHRFCSRIWARLYGGVRRPVPPGSFRLRSIGDRPAYGRIRAAFYPAPPSNAASRLPRPAWPPRRIIMPPRARDARFCEPLHAYSAVLDVVPVLVFGCAETRRNRRSWCRVPRRRRPSGRLPRAARRRLSAIRASGTATCRMAGRARAASCPRGAWRSAWPALDGTAPPRISRRPPVRPRRARPSRLWEGPTACV